jgi:MFS family permease
MPSTQDGGLGRECAYADREGAVETGHVREVHGSDSAMQEWRRSPLLPFAGLIGHATAVFHINGFSPFIIPISTAFGWSRSLTTLGLSMILLMQAASSIPIGMLVDRIGSRQIALVGMISAPLGFALIGTAIGTQQNWMLLWLLMGFLAMPVQSTVWTAAISNSFQRSRGLALSVSMCGTSVASALFPWFGAVLIKAYGWQQAMMIEALIWIALTYPFMFLCFKMRAPTAAPSPGAASVAPVPGMTLRQALRSTIFLRMLFAGALYTFCIPTMIVNFIAIQADGGIEPVRAGKIAASIGIAAIIGRLTSGYLVDRFHASRVGAIAFLLPAVGCAILAVQGVTPQTAVVAGILLGLAMGAELDIMGYLTSRYFGMRHLGALFGCILLSLTLGSGLGHVAASKIFDVTGSYESFILLTGIFSLVCSACFFTLPRPRLLPEAQLPG